MHRPRLRHVGVPERLNPLPRRRARRWPAPSSLRRQQRHRINVLRCPCNVLLPNLGLKNQVRYLAQTPPRCKLRTTMHPNCSTHATGSRLYGRSGRGPARQFHGPGTSRHSAVKSGTTSSLTTGDGTVLPSRRSRTRQGSGVRRLILKSGGFRYGQRFVRKPGGLRYGYHLFLKPGGFSYFSDARRLRLREVPQVRSQHHPGHMLR